MRRLSIALMILSSVAAVPTMAAQQGAPAPVPGPFGAPGVEMLLAQTGTLQLTDAQVVRLAAIARRAEERHRTLRTRLDSLRPRRVSGDSTARRQRLMPPTDLFEREREASHADLRDALAVLTAEQQARAWEMILARRVGGFGGGRGAPFPGRRMRDGRERDGGRDGGGTRQPGRPGASENI